MEDHAHGLARLLDVKCHGQQFLDMPFLE